MEHVGDNVVHLSVGAEMEAYDDQEAAHTVIQGPIARGVQGGGEGLNELHFWIAHTHINPLYRGTTSHVEYMWHMHDDDRVVQRFVVLVLSLLMSDTPWLWLTMDSKISGRKWKISSSVQEDVH